MDTIKHNISNKGERLAIHFKTNQPCLPLINNINLKSQLYTYNKPGLKGLMKLYGYLTGLPLEYGERMAYLQLKSQCFSHFSK